MEEQLGTTEEETGSEDDVKTDTSEETTQNEETTGTEETTNEGPAEGSPRWNQVYGKMKHLERENAEIQNAFNMAQEHNKQLDDKFNTFLTNQTTQAVASKKEGYEQRLEKAAEEGDVGEYHKANLEYLSFLNESSKPIEPTQTQNTKVSESPDKDLDVFKQFNPWYGADQAMTDQAHKINDEMKADPAWNTKSNVAFLAEVGRRTTSHTSLTNNPYASQAPSSGITSAPAAQKKTVVLSAEEKKVAHRLLSGYSKAEAEKKYAAQKLLG